MPEPTPRLTVAFDASAPAPPPKRSRGEKLFYGAVAVFVIARSPAEMMLVAALPVAFAYLGFRVVQGKRDQRQTVRVFDEFLEIEDAFSVARTALKHVHKVVESSTHLLVQMPGGDLAIPLAQLGGDRRTLLDALPPHVAHELAPPPPDARANGRKTLLLWVVLMGVFAALYSFMRAR